jgi:uncharacterized protein
MNTPYETHAAAAASEARASDGHGTNRESTVADARAALKVRLDEEIKAALRSSDRVRLGALRLLSAGIVNREKEVRHALSDDEIRDVAIREAKKRTEAIEAYEAAGRAELAARERQELEAISPYVPERLSEAEVEAIIDEAIASTGASSMKQMGLVMGAVMARARGRVDGAVVQQKVRARLGG